MFYLLKRNLVPENINWPIIPSVDNLKFYVHLYEEIRGRLIQASLA